MACIDGSSSSFVSGAQAALERARWLRRCDETRPRLSDVEALALAAKEGLELDERDKDADALHAVCKWAGVTVDARRAEGTRRFRATTSGSPISLGCMHLGVCVSGAHAALLRARYLATLTYGPCQSCPCCFASARVLREHAQLCRRGQLSRSKLLPVFLQAAHQWELARLDGYLPTTAGSASAAAQAQLDALRLEDFC